jgi:hypothetical protein
MTRPPPLALAYSLAEKLEGLDWAIGGSTLLHRLGLEASPHDLDIVTTVDCFHELDERLFAFLGPGTRPAHASYHSRYFNQYPARDGAVAEVMAGIQVIHKGCLVAWSFSVERIEYHDGLPWMQAPDWLDLYTLFDRPVRVRQIKAYLASARNNPVEPI